MSIRYYLNPQDRTLLYSVACSSYDTPMWSAVSLIALVQVCLVGAVLEAGPVGHRLPPTHAARRPDYTYTAGVGAHKIVTQPVDWNSARRSCDQDGAHLVIIDSVAEAEVVVQLLNASNSVSSHVGIHDLYQEGEFVTIHGEPTVRIGYNVWRAGNPDDWGGEDCVVIHSDAKLNDVPCNQRTSFVCELIDVQPYELQYPQPTDDTILL